MQHRSGNQTLIEAYARRHILSPKIHPSGSDAISELKHRSLCGRNETRTVNLEEQYEKSARAQSKRTEIRLATRLVA